MKKQFFYAAMALAVMSSCSKDNDPGITNPEEEGNDRMPIELGLNTPTISAVSRGTGSVGDVEAGDNTWNDQKLFIYMVNKETGEEAKEGVTGAETAILNNENLEFRAPRDGGSSVRIYQTGTYAPDTDKGTIQYKYYPTNGKYTFFGYHIDDATADAPTITAAEKKVTGITIDGTQDLLAAKTVEMANDDATNDDSPYKTIAANLSAEWADLIKYSFGARTARKSVVPILKFDHQLARLKFFVRAGSKSSAGYKYDNDNSNWVENKAENNSGNTQGIQVTGITLKGMVDKVDMDLATTTSAQNGVSTADFSVCTMNTDGTLDKAGLATTPVVPKYPYGDTNVPDDEDKKGTVVGEPVLFFPNGDIKISIDLKQYVKDTEVEAESGNTITYTTLEKLNNELTIKESSITGASTTQKFLPGASYNVYITIYGFERIEISAVLTAWTEGGDIEADIEDQVSKP